MKLSGRHVSVSSCTLGWDKDHCFFGDYLLTKFGSVCEYVYEMVTKC